MKHIQINIGKSQDALDKAVALLAALGYTVGAVAKSAASTQREEDTSLVAYTYGGLVGMVGQARTVWFRTQGGGEFGDLPTIDFAPKKFKVGEYDAIIDEQAKTVTVGCQTFSFNTVRQVAAAIKGEAFAVQTEEWIPMSRAVEILGPKGCGTPVTAQLVDGTVVKSCGQEVYDDATHHTNKFKGFQL